MTLRPLRFDAIADRVESPQSWRALARRVEEIGFGALHLGDHAGLPSPLPSLVVAADATTALRVGTRVLNAGLMASSWLAREVTTMDLLTGGRFELGVGLGWDRADHAAAGRPFEPLAARAIRLDAMLREMLMLCSGGPRPPPPLTVGGQSDAALSLAARHADGVELTGVSAVAGQHRPDRVGVADVAARIRYLAQLAGERFAHIDLGVRVQVVMIGHPARMSARAVAGATRLTAETILDSPFAMVGTVAEVVGKIRAARERWGITRYSVSADRIDELAPVVAELAGDQRM